MTYRSPFDPQHPSKNTHAKQKSTSRGVRTLPGDHGEGRGSPPGGPEDVHAGAERGPGRGNESPERGSDCTEEPPLREAGRGVSSRDRVREEWAARFGAAVREAREREPVTLEGMAVWLGVSQRQVSRWLKGHTAPWGEGRIAEILQRVEEHGRGSSGSGPVSRPPSQG